MRAAIVFAGDLAPLERGSGCRRSPRDRPSRPHVTFNDKVLPRPRARPTRAHARRPIRRVARPRRRLRRGRAHTPARADDPALLARGAGCRRSPCEYSSHPQAASLVAVLAFAHRDAPRALSFRASRRFSAPPPESSPSCPRPLVRGDPSSPASPASATAVRPADRSSRPCAASMAAVLALAHRGPLYPLASNASRRDLTPPPTSSLSGVRPLACADPLANRELGVGFRRTPERTLLAPASRSCGGCLRPLAP